MFAECSQDLWDQINTLLKASLISMGADFIKQLEEIGVIDDLKHELSLQFKLDCWQGLVKTIKQETNDIALVEKLRNRFIL